MTINSSGNFASIWSLEVKFVGIWDFCLILLDTGATRLRAEGVEKALSLEQT